MKETLDSFQHFFYARDHLVLRMTDEDWDEVIKINLRSVFLCTRAVLKHMVKQRWGRIISITSIVGVVGNPGRQTMPQLKLVLLALAGRLPKR